MSSKQILNYPIWILEIQLFKLFLTSKYCLQFITLLKCSLIIYDSKNCKISITVKLPYVP